MRARSSLAWEVSRGFGPGLFSFLASTLIEVMYNDYMSVCIYSYTCMCVLHIYIYMGAKLSDDFVL